MIRRLTLTGHGVSPARQPSRVWHWIGPGLIMAGAAVGVSHLVQATRAGAEFGLLLLPLVIAICVLKLPFLLFGPRYAAATGKNLLDGYRRVGTTALLAYSLITLGTMFIILAVVTLVTAGLAGVVLGLAWPTWALAALVFAACGAILALGQYKGLDLGMKLLMAVLAVSTLAAAALAFGQRPDWTTLSGIIEWPRLASAAGLAFLLALMGWMPIPLDVAVWHSLWTLERQNPEDDVDHRVRGADFDFYLGFWIATGLAVIFVLIGAFLLHATGSLLPDSAVGFAAALVALYTQVLGEWAGPIIAVAALTTMFSTTLAVLDAYPRVLVALRREWMIWRRLRHCQPVRPYPLGPTIELSRPTLPLASRAQKSRLGLWFFDRLFDASTREYRLYLVVMTLGALGLITGAGTRFVALVDLATMLSFLATPVLAIITYRAILSEGVAVRHRPGRAMRSLAWLGIAFTSVFAIAWLIWRFKG